MTTDGKLAGASTDVASSSNNLIALCNLTVAAIGNIRLFVQILHRMLASPSLGH